MLLSGCGVSTVAGAAPTAPVQLSVVAAPTSIAPNGTAMLTVQASNATAVTISGSDGSNFALSASGGAQVVKPSTTTTYTVAANGPAGTKTATAIVTVLSPSLPPPAPPVPPIPPIPPAPPAPPAVAAPTVTATANPLSITADSSSILSIVAANATGVTIAGSDGTRFTLPSGGGTEAVSPAATATYTVTANGPGGQASTSVTINVTPNPAPTVTVTAMPSSTTPGGNVVLSVNASHADSVVVTGSDGTSYTLPASSAQQAVTPAGTTTYTATAKGPGGQTTATVVVTVTAVPSPSVSLVASPASIVAGNSATLTVTAANATGVTVTGNDGSSYPLPAAGGTQVVTPSKTTTYTATSFGTDGKTTATAEATIMVAPAAQSGVEAVDHVILLLQENRSFDTYFGMLNPYRVANHFNVGDDGQTYSVDGIDDKLGSLSNTDDEGQSFQPFKFTSTCVDDMTSSWLESYGDVDRYDFSPSRAIAMDGFVHTAEGYAKSCSGGTAVCAGSFSSSNLTGRRAMGFYDQDTLNYYYAMASQFAVADRWFTPVSSKSTPNRIATYTGGTTQGLVLDPFRDDRVQGQLADETIFKELDNAGESWKIYYTVTQGGCQDADDCPGSSDAQYPATTFADFQDSYKYLHVPPQAGVCTAPTVPSSAVGDDSNSFCIDPSHIAPVSQYFKDAASGTLPAFAFIEAGYGVNDEHPGSGQSILKGQAEVAGLINGLMSSPSWKDSVFFVAYDEAGGPYDHVPPVPGHSNDYTTLVKGAFPDIGSIAVNPDSFLPCPAASGTNGPADNTLHCDVPAGDPGASSSDAAAEQGFAAQIGFRVPNMIVSPFTRRHYVGHVPMDHTAVIRFVENRFIGSSAHLTHRDAAQPDLLDFFDFTNKPWLTPPANIPAPLTDPSGSTCHADSFAPTP